MKILITLLILSIPAISLAGFDASGSTRGSGIAATSGVTHAEDPGAEYPGYEAGYQSDTARYAQQQARFENESTHKTHIQDLQNSQSPTVFGHESAGRTSSNLLP